MCAACVLLHCNTLGAFLSAALTFFNSCYMRNHLKTVWKSFLSEMWCLMVSNLLIRSEFYSKRVWHKCTHTFGETYSHAHNAFFCHECNFLHLTHKLERNLGAHENLFDRIWMNNSLFFVLFCFVLIHYIYIHVHSLTVEWQIKMGMRISFGQLISFVAYKESWYNSDFYLCSWLQLGSQRSSKRRN